MNSSSLYIDKIQKQADHSSETTENQAIIYQGRTVYLEITSAPTLVPSFLNRFMKMASYIFDEPLGHMTERLPKGLVKMMARMDEMYDQIHNPPKQQDSFLSRFLLKKTVEQEMAEEEERRTVKKQMEEKLEEVIHQLGTQRNQQLQLAKVSTMAEFQEKQKKIMSYQAEAEKRYLENSIHLERRKEIDRQIVMAYKEGVLTEKDVRIIEEYWNATQTSQGQKQIEAIKGRTAHLFSKSLFNCLDQMADEMEQRMKDETQIKPSQFIASYFHEIAQKASQEFIQEREKCQIEEEKLILDYLFLTEGYQLSAILNHMLRMALQTQLEQANRAAEIWIDYERRMNRDLIKYHERAIENAQEEIALYKEEYASAKSEEMQKYCLERNLKMIPTHEEWIEKYKKIIEEEQKKTDKDFRNQAYARMNALAGENPQEIRALIPKQTHFETLMLKMMSLETGEAVNLSLQSPIAFRATPDFQLDLKQLPEPVDYFCQQIERKDQQKLSLITHMRTELNGNGN